MFLHVYWSVDFFFLEANQLQMQGGGRKRLPKFKILGKISHMFTHDFTNTDKKIRK